MKVEDFEVIVKKQQLVRGEALLENTPVEVKISRN